MSIPDFLIITPFVAYTIVKGKFAMKIVFTGGGSAGHVTPNLALIDKLQGEIYYIGTNGIEKTLLQPYLSNGKVAEYYQISASKLQRKLTLKNLALPFALRKSVIQAKEILQKIRPDVVFSKGGYVGLPVVIACKKLGIPSIIHENDMSLGLANRLCVRYATEFISAFACDKRAKVVGLILRNMSQGDREKGLQTMGFDGSKPILLVTGGSLGATALNDAISQDKSIADRFDVFVITGKGKQIDCDFVHQAQYVDNMADVLSASDVCVTRSGTNTIAELTAMQVPFVAVPLTKCSRGEQIKNARWFANHGCCIVVNEQELQERLVRCVNTAYDNRLAIQTKQRLTLPIIDGTDKVIETILDYGK